MKTFKVLFSVLALLFVVNTGFAQKKMKKAKAAEKINQALTSIDENLALTAEQIEQITALDQQVSKDLKALKNSDASEEDMKAQKKEIKKAFKKEVSNSILSEEQKQAQKAAKKAKKAAKG